MSEPVEASLSIELHVECPECEHFFDLFQIDDGRLNEEGWLISRACPDGYWAEDHAKFKLDIECPECKSKINIRGIVW